MLVLSACGGGSGGADVVPLAVDTTAPKLDVCPAEGHVDTLGVRGLTPNEIANLPITYTSTNLAHVVGLGHTREEGSLMYPDAARQTIRPTGFSKSDLAGLRYLGRDAGCVKSPSLPSG